MYYQKPEIEIIVLEEDVFTENTTTPSQTGDDWGDNYNPWDINI